MFRIFLAINVVITHTLPFKLGKAAVYLFFALSGYWILSMWQREYQKTHAPWRIFLISRAWRLLPVYILCIGICVAATALLPVSLPPIQHSSPAHFYFSNLFILGLTWLPIPQRILDPAWSLDIEIQFYIIAPLLIWLAMARRSSAYMIGMFAAAIGFAACYLIFYEGERAISAPMPMYALFFIIGLATARFAWKPAPWLSNAGALLGIIYVAAILSSHKTRGLLLEGHFTTAISHYETAANFGFALLLIPYAMATVRVDVRKRSALVAAIDRHLSNLTYEVYLVHAAVLFVLHPYIAGLSRYRQLPYFGAAYVVIAVLSLLIYHFYDQPIDRLRRNYVRALAPVEPKAVEPKAIEPLLADTSSAMRR